MGGSTLPLPREGGTLRVVITIIFMLSLLQQSVEEGGCFGRGLIREGGTLSVPGCNKRGASMSDSLGWKRCSSVNSVHTTDHSVHPQLELLQRLQTHHLKDCSVCHFILDVVLVCC